MTKRYRIGIIGLGVIGRRMLANMPNQGRLEVASGWDLSAETRAAAVREFPWLAVADNAGAILSDPGVDLIYIGVPPGAHADYARAAIDAGKAVFCEKPLGIDIAGSRALTALAAETGANARVNLSLAAARGVAAMRAALADGSLGTIAGADIRLRFARWPRGWQESARWLAERAEGGFVREVGTHFVYLAEDLLGPLRLISGSCAYPADGKSAETHALARLEAGHIPVTLAGSAGGAGPDLVEFTLWGSEASLRLTDFYRLWQSTGGGWAEVFPQIENPALDAYMLQLDELVRCLDGEATILPGFGEALSAQEIVEAVLRQA